MCKKRAAAAGRRSAANQTPGLRIVTLFPVFSRARRALLKPGLGIDYLFPVFGRRTAVRPDGLGIVTLFPDTILARQALLKPGLETDCLFPDSIRARRTKKKDDTPHECHPLVFQVFTAAIFTTLLFPPVPPRRIRVRRRFRPLLPGCRR